MTQLEFSYDSQFTDPDEEAVTDTGMVSFNVDFSAPPGLSDFRRTCYTMALDEVTAILAEKYGEGMFDNNPDISITISGLTISNESAP